MAGQDSTTKPIRIDHILNPFSGYELDHDFHPLYNHLIFLLLIVHTTLYRGAGVFVRRCSTQFFFVLAFWHPPNHIPVIHIYMLDVSFNQVNCRDLQLENYFEIANHGGVIEAVVKTVNPQEEGL